MNWEAERDMARDVEENKELYEAMAADPDDSEYTPEFEHRLSESGDDRECTCGFDGEDVVDHVVENK